MPKQMWDLNKKEGFAGYTYGGSKTKKTATPTYSSSRAGQNYND